jgi:hypothetical protein
MNNIIVFVDGIGRAIIGSEQSELSTDTQVAVKNPSIINVNVGENGQISVQLFPFVFRELLVGDSRENGVVWKYNRSSITENTGVELDERLTTQYENLFLNPPPEAPLVEAADTSEPEVVQLFDDEKEDETTTSEAES